MKTLLTILTVALFATAHAQTITGRDYITGTINLPGTVQFNRDSVPKRCWGITEDDRTALRLYPSVVEKQKWYDFSTYKFKGEGKRAVWIAYAIAGAFTLGVSKQPIKYRIADAVLAFAGFSLFANASYELLR